MSFILDPQEVAYPGRVELDLMTDHLMVRAEGIDWGDAALELHRAKGRRGQQVVDVEYPNRIITAPVRVSARGEKTFEEALGDLQAKVARIAEEGGHLKRVRRSGDPLYADIVVGGATLQLPDSWLQEHRGVEPEATLILECLPDFYGDEITLQQVNDDGGAVLAVETEIKGNFPARTRLIVENRASDRSLQGVMYGFRSRHYDASATAALVYPATSLTPVSPASVFGGKVRHQALDESEWTAVLQLQVGGSNLTHTGTYRVWVLAENGPGSSVTTDLRLAWGQGGLAGATINDAVRHPRAAYENWLDLGLVRLDRHAKASSWTGVIQARGEEVRLSSVVLQPVDESAGHVSVAPPFELGAAQHAIRDPFGQSGNITGKTAPVGGTYVALTNSDSTDFAASGGELVRTAASDSGSIYSTSNEWTRLIGRAVGLDVNLLRVRAGVDFTFPYGAGIRKFGLLVNVQDVNNFVVVYLWSSVNGLIPWALLRRSGTVGSVYSINEPIPGTQGVDVNGRLMVESDGLNLRAWVSISGGPPMHVLSTQLFDVGAGGVYLYDENATSASLTRRYRNLTAWGFEPEAAVFPLRRLELTSGGCAREMPGGDDWGTLSLTSGDLPRLPVTGREGRGVEMLVVGTEGDFDGAYAHSEGFFRTRLAYRPCWLTVPEPASE